MGQQLVRAAVLCVAAGLATAIGASAQIPSAAEARRLVQENPELVREQILQSGLSQSEIRARLAAFGLPPDALDQFLSGDSIDMITAFDDNALSALERLGIAVETVDGLELVEVTSGLQPQPAREQILINGLPIFGLDIFTRASTQFQPLLSGPVPDEYLLGPNDRIVVILTGDVELTHELVVTREGFIVVPTVGRISVANLTMAELRLLLRNRLADSYSGITLGTTFVDVTITEVRSIQIYVTGEVAQAGAYQLASVATVTNALYAAGGPTELASLRQINVQRRDGDKVTLDLYPYLLDGDVSGDVILQQGGQRLRPAEGSTGTASRGRRATGPLRIGRR